MAPSQDRMANEEQWRENFHQQIILMHSKSKPDNCTGGHSEEVYGLSFPPEKT
jgi:hypothetical protein